MNDMFSEALLIASHAHYGTTDKGGQPYIKHALRVYEGVRDDGGSLNAQIVAILHDLIEDSDVTLTALMNVGFDSEVLTSLSLLTHTTNQKLIDAWIANGKTKEDAVEREYIMYIYHIKQNAIAKIVKKHDLKHNSDISRVPVEMIHTGKFINRLAKYIKAYNFLMEE